MANIDDGLAELIDRVYFHSSPEGISALLQMPGAKEELAKDINSFSRKGETFADALARSCKAAHVLSLIGTSRDARSMDGFFSHMLSLRLYYARELSVMEAKNILYGHDDARAVAISNMKSQKSDVDSAIDRILDSMFRLNAHTRAVAIISRKTRPITSSETIELARLVDSVLQKLNDQKVDLKLVRIAIARMKPINGAPASAALRIPIKA